MASFPVYPQCRSLREVYGSGRSVVGVQSLGMPATGGEWEGTGGRGDGHSATTLAAVAALAPPLFDLPPPPR